MKGWSTGSRCQPGGGAAKLAGNHKKAASAMKLSLLLIVAATVVALSVAAWVWQARKRRKTPAERERVRRLAVNATGRLVEGILVDDPSAQIPSPNPELVFYQYRAGGMEYVAAQDISALADLLDRASCRPGSAVAVKYDPRRPSNSIVVCELWNGLLSRSKSEQNSPPAIKRGTRSATLERNEPA